MALLFFPLHGFVPLDSPSMVFNEATSTCIVSHPMGCYDNINYR